MIIYDNGSWFGLVFRYSGTVWERTWHLTLTIVLLCALAYVCEVSSNMRISNPGHTILGSTMSYLLVFRANAASQRYWMGKTFLTQTFLDLRHLIMTACVMMKGGAASEAWRDRRDPNRGSLIDAMDLKASMARVNFVRLVLAYVVALKLHTRIAATGYTQGFIEGDEKRMVDLDRLRLRGLMTRQEYETVSSMVPIFNEGVVVSGAALVTPEAIEEALEQPLADSYEVDTAPDMRQPLAILMLIRLEIMKHMAEQYGIRDRFAKDMMGITDKLSTVFEHISTLISTPIPFPYVHLCKVLLISFLMTLPLVQDPDNGIFAAVCMPGFLAMSLLGIDAIATELADPYGDDRNDLDVTGLINALEDECLRFLDLSGDSLALEAFIFAELPDAGLNDDPRYPTEYVCLSSQVVISEEVASGDHDFPVNFRPSRRPLFDTGQSAGMTGRSSRMTGSCSSSGFIQAGGGGRRVSSKESSTGRKAARAKESQRRRSGGDDEDEDEREPLLSGRSPDGDSGRRFRPMGSQMSSSQVQFRPMEDMGSEAETIVFESEDHDDHGRGPDCVGLSDDEGEDGPAGGGSVGSGGFQPMHSDLRGSASPSARRSSRNSRGSDREKRRKKSGGSPQKLDMGMSGSLVGSIGGGGTGRRRGGDSEFRPMEEMGTQTIHFSEGELGENDGPDVVGLSDEEDDELGMDMLDSVDEASGSLKSKE